MSELLHLRIPEPCHKDWGKMTPEDKGRFCDSCQKTVVDFTQSTHDEIYDTYQAAEGKVCGHFNASQLGGFRPTAIADRRRFNFLKRFVAAALIVFGTTLFLIPNHATAQQLEQLRDTTIDARGEKHHVTIQGNVTAAETGQPLMFVTMTLYKRQTAVANAFTDPAGNFSLEIPAACTDKREHLTLQAMYLGYVTISVPNVTGTEPHRLQMREDYTQLDGDFIIGDIDVGPQTPAKKDCGSE